MTKRTNHPQKNSAQPQAGVRHELKLWAVMSLEVPWSPAPGTAGWNLGWGTSFVSHRAPEILQLVSRSPVCLLRRLQPARLPPPQEQTHRLTRWEPGPGPEEGPGQPHPGLARVWESGRSAARLLTAARSLPLGEPLPAPLCLGSPLSSLGPQVSPPAPHPSRDGPNPTSLQHMIHKCAHF